MSDNDAEIVLIVADDCPPCERAHAVWDRECRRRGVALSVHDADSAEGLRLLAGQPLTAVPVLLVNGRIIAVGLQTPDEAGQILDRHAVKRGRD